MAFAARAQQVIMDRAKNSAAGPDTISKEVGSSIELESAIEREMGDCGTRGIQFTGIMRANGIPSRMRVGRWAAIGDEANPYQVHVKTDFFAEGIGWVNVEFTEPANPDNEEGAFGTDGRFLTFHENTDMEVVTPERVETINLIQAAGTLPIGAWNQQGMSSKQTWNVETL